MVAFEHGAISDPTQMYLADLYTISINIAGNGGITVPVGLGAQSGMPVAAQLVAPRLWMNASSRLALPLSAPCAAKGAPVLGVAPAFAGKGGELA